MLGRLANPKLILLSLPGILVAFVLHEWMHAFTADRMGDPTPRNMGRLTLNPMAHVDPVGMLMFVFMGFGWAKPVQVNPANYHQRRKGMLLVPLAGPLTNLALGFVFAFVLYSVQGMALQYHIHENWIAILYYAAQINFILFVFNLLPIAPLDGYQILRAGLLGTRASLRPLAVFEQYGMLILLALIFTGALSFVLGYFNSAMFSLSDQLYNWLFRLIR